MMNVILYQYNDRERIVNKYNAGNAMVEVANINLTPYGRFDWNDITFTLKKMYKCNYATYTYNGIKYSGYVTISVRADGLNEYHITNDPLTTCWENGCFNAAALCVYSSVGDSPVMDKRVMRNAKPKVLTYEKEITTNEPYYAITIAFYISEGHYKRRPYNPTFKTYIMSASNFRQLQLAIIALAEQAGPDPATWNIVEIFRNIYKRFVGGSEKEAARIAAALQSVVGCYMIKYDELPNLSAMPTTSTIDLITINQYGAQGYDGYTIPDFTSYIYEYGTDRAPCKPFEKYVDISMGLSYDNFKEDAEFNVLIPDMGNIQFNWANIYNRSSTPIDFINSIGYVKRYDFVSGTAAAEIVINHGHDNEVICHDLSIQAAIPYQSSLLADTSITDFKSLQMSIASSAIGSIGSAGNLVGAAGVPNPSALISTATSGIQANIGRYQMLQDTEVRELSAASSKIGGIGSSVDYARNPMVVVKYKDPINNWAIGNLYGFPDGQARYLTSIKGYVQTQGCELFVNGLPKDLVQEAETLCNDGVYIL